MQKAPVQPEGSLRDGFKALVAAEVGLAAALVVAPSGAQDARYPQEMFPDLELLPDHYSFNRHREVPTTLPPLAMTSRHLLFALCASLFACTAAAQPQWRFHLAFEDGTGARDTIWFVYDTTATVGSSFNPQVDEHLGEGGMEMDLNAFNVWLGNWDGDSTKTLAYPYSYFPQHGYQLVNAFNFVLPLTIRWERALLNATYLPTPDSINFAVLNGEYFYWYGNEPFEQVFSLMHADSVVVGLEALWNPLFPTTLLIGHMQGDPLGVEELLHDQVQWGVDGHVLRISGELLLEDLLVHDGLGRLIYSARPGSNMAEIRITNWPAGLYIFRVRSSNTWHHGKFIKVDP